MRSGGTNLPLCRWCLPELSSILAKGSDSSQATPAPRVHGISGLSVWDGSLGPRDGIRTVNWAVGAMSCARDDGKLRSYGVFSKSIQMSILAHFGPNWTKTSFLTKIFFRKWLHLFRHPQISLVELCSVRFWGGRRSTTNDGCSGFRKCNPQSPGEKALHADYLGKRWSSSWDSVQMRHLCPDHRCKALAQKPTVGRIRGGYFPNPR